MSDTHAIPKNGKFAVWLVTDSGTLVHLDSKLVTKKSLRECLDDRDVAIARTLLAHCQVKFMGWDEETP